MREFVGVHTSEEQPGIATVLLSRPPTNALTRQVYRELHAAADELTGRDARNVVTNIVLERQVAHVAGPRPIWQLALAQVVAVCAVKVAG